MPLRCGGSGRGRGRTAAPRREDRVYDEDPMVAGAAVAGLAFTGFGGMRLVVLAVVVLGAGFALLRLAARMGRRRVGS